MLQLNVVYPFAFSVKDDTILAPEVTGLRLPLVGIAVGETAKPHRSIWQPKPRPLATASAIFSAFTVAHDSSCNDRAARLGDLNVQPAVFIHLDHHGYGSLHEPPRQHHLPKACSKSDPAGHAPAFSDHLSHAAANPWLVVKLTRAMVDMGGEALGSLPCLLE
ncbi:hypothetical protein K470DRAFT_268448 [Piedraia hortae CBS 480.64]|uniref:Uncharacterized protein n=1 Tax=Piedraia hortae CBS 480.64 TaxID=1314780 RepID=A0A6A7C880_9PEZI|nr:hypothetical protein K470DRAFT_268448 [Piedraia hortae CBS 480.64]